MTSRYSCAGFLLLAFWMQPLVAQTPSLEATLEAMNEIYRTDGGYHVEHDINTNIGYFNTYTFKPTRIAVDQTDPNNTTLTLHYEDESIQYRGEDGRKENVMTDKDQIVLNAVDPESIEVTERGTFSDGTKMGGYLITFKCMAACFFNARWDQWGSDGFLKIGQLESARRLARALQHAARLIPRKKPPAF